MSVSQNTNLLAVDWSKIPPPVDDGTARHLTGMSVPAISLMATDGRRTVMAALDGRTIVFAYPMTGRPGVPLPQDWDLIPGARGCTPQACAFRDLAVDLRIAGANHIFGLSTQEPDYQREAAARLHLPFALLSDAELTLTKALDLPTVVIEGKTLLRRLTLVIDDGSVSKVFYPVFPPDQNAGDVLEWLRANPR